MTRDEIQAFGHQLLARVGNAPLPGKATVWIEDWKPQEHYCHDNVATWVRYNPQDKHVFGFNYFSLNNMMPYVIFAPHSVVEMGGELMDITPHGVTTRYPFIRFEGTAEEFEPWGALGNFEVFVDRG